MKTIIYILPLIFFLNSQAKIDFRKKKIELIPIDTSELFIYETKSAKLKFSQSDILRYFDEIPESEKVIYQDFIDTLNLNKNVIHIYTDTIYDKVYEFDRGNGLIEIGEFPSGKDKRDYLSGIFMFIASDLMLQGKVMPYSKTDKKNSSKYILAKKEKGIMGSEYLVFRTKNKTLLYQIIITLGE